jgi:hypothetical protein
MVVSRLLDVLYVTDDKKPRYRTERVQFSYRYVIHEKTEEDECWISFKDMVEHPQKNQFVGCLYSTMLWRLLASPDAHTCLDTSVITFILSSYVHRRFLLVSSGYPFNTF